MLSTTISIYQAVWRLIDGDILWSQYLLVNKSTSNWKTHPCWMLKQGIAFLCMLLLWPLVLKWNEFIPACLSNYVPSKVRDKIIYQFPNLNGSTFEVWE